MRYLFLALLVAALVVALFPLLRLAGKPRVNVPGVAFRIPWRVRLQMARAGGDVGLLFFRRGRSSAILVPAITGFGTGAGQVTVAELAAGTPLSKAVAGIAGFETALNRINQPVMAYAEELQIDGPQTFADASFTMLEDDGAGSDGDSVARQTAYTALDEGTGGFMVLAPNKAGALVATDDCELWPIKVGARNRGWGLEAEAARYTVQFAITGAPQKDAAVIA